MKTINSTTKYKLNNSYIFEDTIIEMSYDCIKCNGLLHIDKHINGSLESVLNLCECND